MNFTPAEARNFWTKVSMTGPKTQYARKRCWIWTANENGHGYGVMRFRNKRIYAHMLSFLIHKGEIPDGKEIDHICRTRNCVRPSHLRAVTHRENMLSGNTIVAIQAARTHCPKGHPLSGDNLYLHKGKRGCLICRRQQARDFNAEKRRANA